MRVAVLDFGFGAEGEESASSGGGGEVGIADGMTGGTLRLGTIVIGRRVEAH